jgi:hypothetical protein
MFGQLAKSFTMNLLRRLAALFRAKSIERMYGACGFRNSSIVYREPSYSTNPQDYDIPLFDPPVTADEYQRQYRETHRVFRTWDEAVDFAYHCNLDSVWMPVYCRSNPSQPWVYDHTETKRLVMSVAW